MLVSFDIVDMFRNLGYMKGVQTVKIALDNGQVKKHSTEYISEEMEICLYNSYCKLDQDYLLQANGTTTSVPNSFSYSDLAIYRLDRLIRSEKINELF